MLLWSKIVVPVGEIAIASVRQHPSEGEVLVCLHVYTLHQFHRRSCPHMVFRLEEGLVWATNNDCAG